MSFRLRLIVVSALAVATAIALVSGIVYLSVRRQLYSELRSSLQARAAQAAAFPKNATGVTLPPCYSNEPPSLVARLGGYFQTIYASGAVRSPVGFPAGTSLTVSREDRQVAAGRIDSYYRKGTVSGQGSGVRIPVYVYVTRLTPNTSNCALEVARPLESVTQPLKRLEVVLLVVSLAGIGLAVVLGWVIAGTALRPVRHMTEASEHVTRTRDLSRRIEMQGRDELARLARAFNTMLEALDVSLRSQRQLVADASHELGPR